MADQGPANKDNPNPNKKKGAKKPPENRKPWSALFWFSLVLLAIYILQFSTDTNFGKNVSGTTKELENDLKNRFVDRVKYKQGELIWKLNEGAPKKEGKSREKRAVVSEIPDSTRALIDQYTQFGLEEEKPSMWLQILLNFGPWLILLLIFYFFFFRQIRSAGGGNIFNFGKSRATLIQAENINKNFSDVAGVDEAKEELTEIVEFLKDPEKFTKLGGRLPRGVLLNGPPGTGKTLLAKAIAGEAGVPFYSISGSDFVEMFVGVGASRVRDLFSQAKEASPSIIFLDEIDAVGRRRGSGLGGGHDEREQTLNAILVEMDGFDSDESVIVIASTNRVDVLDPALLRPGRFDRHVAVGLPDIDGRKEILKVHSKKIKLSSETNLDTIAQGTPGFSGADLENILNESALIAVAKGKQMVETDDIEQARDKVAFGKEKKSTVMHKDDLKITAYHESGHALVSLKTPGTIPLHKLTIIPRGNALGAAFYFPERDETHRRKSFIIGQIATLYGGRIAEEIFFDNDVTTGASNDIQRATEFAKKMVTEWGMSEKLGLINFEAGEERMFLGGEITRSKSFSEDTAKIIDDEVSEITTKCYQMAKDIITENKDILEKIAEKLLVYETLTGDEVRDLVEGRDLERKPPINTVIKHLGEVKKNGSKPSEDAQPEEVEAIPVQGEDASDDSGAPPKVDTTA